jgi:hypothetical protein
MQAIPPTAATNPPTSQEDFMNEHPTPGNTGHHDPDRPEGTDPQMSVRLHGPQDMPAAIPYLLGYQPEQGDVVIVALSGPRRRIELSIVYHLAGPTAISSLWEDFVTHPNRPDMDTACLIAYLPAGAEPELQALAASARPLLGEVLRVNSGLWWCLSCPDLGRCCPSQGTALKPLSDEQAAVFAAGGLSAGGERASIGELLRPGAQEQIAQVETDLETLRRGRRSGAVPIATPENHYELLRTTHARFAAGPLSLPTGQKVALLDALSDRAVRDRCLPWHDDAAWWLWSALIAYAPPSHVAGVASLLAAVAYQRGDGVSARIAAEHALSHEPGHTLSTLLLQALHLRIHPRVFTEEITGALREKYLD